MNADECIICLEEYSTSNMPQLLPCSHMICNICITNLPTGELECPLCRNPYSKAQIVPNFDLISKLMKNQLINLNILRQQFEKRLEETVQSEIDKQLHCINHLNQIENEIIKIFSNIRKQFNEAMDFNTMIKEEILDKIQEDIAVLTNLSKNIFDNQEAFSSAFKSIESKYQEKNISVMLKSFDTVFWENTIPSFSDLPKKYSEVLLTKREVSLFGKNSVDLIYTPAGNQVNKHTSTLLFNPCNNKLNLFDMQQKQSSIIQHNLIKSESKCIHLHPETVAIVTNENIIYIDINDNTFYLTPFRFSWKGFCLGRHNGDLVVIGGTRLEGGRGGRDVLYLFKRKDWRNLPSLAEERIHAASETILRKIYVFGGIKSRSIEVFYLNSWTVLNVKMDIALSHIVTCSDSESIYLIGGSSSSSFSGVSKSIFKFSISNSSFKLLDTIEYEILKDSNVSACWVNNQIFYNVGEKLYQYDLKF